MRWYRVWLLALLILLGPTSLRAQEAGNTLLLDNIRQYAAVSGDGKHVFVIEGTVQNNTSTTQGYIGVSVVLYDAAGSTLSTVRCLCGNGDAATVVSDLSYDELIAPQLQSLQQSGVVHGVPFRGHVPFRVVLPRSMEADQFSISAYVLDLGAEQ